MKRIILLAIVAVCCFAGSNAQVTKALGLYMVENTYSLEYVCVLYNDDGKPYGALKENNGAFSVEAFSEDKIEQYTKFSLANLLDNSLNLTVALEKYVVRNGSGLTIKTEKQREAAFETQGEGVERTYIKPQSDRDVFYFTIVDKGKETGFIELEKPILGKKKMRLYIVSR